MQPKFFKSSKEFRDWLVKNHEIKDELIVGFYKKGTAKFNMTWSESVDEALCFGWIDGVRNSVDEESYCIRFTKRRPSSIWSAVNVDKINKLIASNKMFPAGLKAFEALKENKSKIYSYETDALILSKPFEIEFKKNQKAWAFFQTLAPSYKKNSINWIMSAKQESTQLKRLSAIIQESEAGLNRWKNNKWKK